MDAQKSRLGQRNWYSESAPIGRAYSPPIDALRAPSGMQIRGASMRQWPTSLTPLSGVRSSGGGRARGCASCVRRGAQATHRRGAALRRSSGSGRAASPPPLAVRAGAALAVPRLLRVSEQVRWKGEQHSKYQATEEPCWNCPFALLVRIWRTHRQRYHQHSSGDGKRQWYISPNFLRGLPPLSGVNADNKRPPLADMSLPCSISRAIARGACSVPVTCLCAM